MTDPLHSKQALRHTMRLRRTGLQRAERRKQEQRLCQRLAAILRRRGPGAVATYIAMGSEINLTKLLKMRDLRARLHAPRIQGQRLLFHRPSKRLQMHSLGMLEPRKSLARRIWSLNAVLVPLLACDRQGRRLGQGGGYYDRTLAIARPRRPLCIGIGFDQQLVDRLPAEGHDQGLDIFLSASHALAFSARGQQWLTGY